MGRTPLLRILGNNRYIEDMSDEEIRDWVIEQACDAYAKNEIDLERLEADIWALLNNKSPVGKDGMPIYYDPRMF